jgi:hypothetical protein
MTSNNGPSQNAQRGLFANRKDNVSDSDSENDKNKNKGAKKGLGGLGLFSGLDISRESNKNPIGPNESGNFDQASKLNSRNYEGSS